MKRKWVSSRTVVGKMETQIIMESNNEEETKMLDRNVMLCNCKQVSYADVEDALHQMDKFSDVVQSFDEVQKITHCSTGCGGCHDKIMEAISEIMMA